MWISLRPELREYRLAFNVWLQTEAREQFHILIKAMKETALTILSTNFAKNARVEAKCL